MQVINVCLAAWSPRAAAHGAARLAAWAVGLTLWLYTAPTSTAQVMLAWDPSPSAGVEGYRLYYGPLSGIYTASRDVGQVTTATVPGLTCGQTYYFVATVYNNTMGTESPWSNEVSTMLPPCGGATLSTSPTSVAAGGTVTATWAGIPSPTAVDWLGLYTPGTSDTAYLAWRYTSGPASGNGPFTIPSTLAPGTYELRLLSNNGFTRLATSNTFTVR